MIVYVRYTDEEQDGVGASWPILFTGGTQFIIGNAGRATANGFEVEFSWQATDNLLLNSSVSVIDAEYDEFSGAQCVENSAGQPECYVGVATNGFIASKSFGIVLLFR